MDDDALISGRLGGPEEQEEYQEGTKRRRGVEPTPTN
jgi:hypothetical protein